MKKSIVLGCLSLLLSGLIPRGAKAQLPDVGPEFGGTPVRKPWYQLSCGYINGVFAGTTHYSPVTFDGDLTPNTHIFKLYGHINVPGHQRCIVKQYQMFKSAGPNSITRRRALVTQEVTTVNPETPPAPISAHPGSPQLNPWYTMECGDDGRTMTLYQLVTTTSNPHVFRWVNHSYVPGGQTCTVIKYQRFFSNHLYTAVVEKKPVITQDHQK